MAMRAADSRDLSAHAVRTPELQNNFRIQDRPEFYDVRDEKQEMRVEPSSVSDISLTYGHMAALQERREPDDRRMAAMPTKQNTQNPQSDESGVGGIVRDLESSDELNRIPSKTKLEVELATKQREISHLVDEMERLQSSINNLKEMSTTKISQLEDIVSEKDRVIKELAEKLLRQQDYSDLKRELRLLKSLEVNGWQPWCPPERAATPSIEPSKPEIADANVSSPVDTLNGAESTSPCSGTPEDPDSVPATPPSESSQPRSPLTDISGPSVQRLHHCIRSNVERFSGEALDTLGIARCVRELLSAHNIGQRMFAKLVLGLSQGTVSELLSKPKPWDKLTEKGRDSYRKMHAWACDQHCVHLLKSLLPRKGRDGAVVKMESSSLEQRQTEASAVTNSPQEEVNNNNNKDQKCNLENADDEKTNRIFTDNNNLQRDNQNQPHHHHQHYRSFHHHHMGLLSPGKQPFPCGGQTDFPPMVLAHFYQEELLKLLGKRLKEGYADDHAKQAQDDVRQALSIYHRELVLLAQQGLPSVSRPSDTSPASHSPPCQTCTTMRRHHCNLPYCPSDQSCCLPDRSGPYSVISPYSGSSPLLPLPSEAAQAPGSEESSPLQRMQSITNSLLSQTASPNFANLPQRPSKAVLPPITQQQFDQYNNLNTEDIVKRVKEQLSQYSISQRLFGENVLGLSQGSVSDLLARPKPWHMLTQKGREPFIRMKMFLEDESAVHKLVASQYKIAPERLMRIGGYGVPPTNAGPGNHGAPRFGPMCSDAPYASHQQQQQQQQQRPQPMEGRQALSKAACPLIPSSSPRAPSTPESRESAPPTARSPSGPCAALPPTNPPKTIGNFGRRGGGHHARCLPCVQPSVYEMAAVTTDLDTHLVTARIKETLTVHNIGQKLFGEAVLGLSQGSVSELLSKPKPWHMLSIKGREPFIRMQLWLNDPSNVEKLQAIKSERREANKRRRSNIEAEMHTSLHTEKPPPLPMYPLDLPPVFLYPPVKKPRILFSEEQKEALKLAYSLDSYPSTAVMEFLSNELGLSVRTITNWFHNHRMRLKQLQPGSESEADSDGSTRPPGVEGGTFDPIRFRALLSQRLVEMCNQPSPANSDLPMLPYFGEHLRLCPPGFQQHHQDSTSNVSADGDTLDLSMSSQKFPQRQHDSNRDFESVHSTSEERDEPKDNASDNGNTTRTSKQMRESVSNIVSSSGGAGSSNHSNTSSGSNRRKAAAPQWVNPGLDLSPDSDLCSFDEDDDFVEQDHGFSSWKDDQTTASSGGDFGKQIINGVCVRQTDLIEVGQRQGVEDSQVVQVLPAPAMDERIMREKNVERLERAIVEQEEGWDFTDSDGDESEISEGSNLMP